MADLALAVTSLGLTACKGLIHVLTAWIDYGNDVRETRLQIEALNDLLTELHHTLQNQTTRLAALVRNRIVDCHGGLERLREQVEQVQSRQVASHGVLRNTGRHLVRRLVYPFTQSSLKKLRFLARHLQNELGLALHAAVLNEVRANSLALYRIDNNILSLREPVEAVQKVTAMLPPQLDRGFQAQTRATENLSVNIEDLLLSMSNLKDSVGILPGAIEAGNRKTLAGTMRTDQKLLDMPSRFINDLGPRLDAMESRWSTELATLTQSIESRGLVPRYIPHKIPSSTCAEAFSIAQELQIADSNPLSDLHRFHPEIRKTSKQLFRPHRQQTRKYRLRLRWLSRFLVLTFQSNYGAGGLSIGACLQLSGVVVKKSPVFHIILKLRDQRWMNVSPEKLETSAKDIASLYESQQASPGDVDDDGKNALHLLLEVSQLVLWDSTTSESYLKLFNILLKSGVPLNEFDKSSVTPLGYLVSCENKRPMTEPVFCSLASQGAESMLHPRRFHSTYFYSWLRVLNLLSWSDYDQVTEVCRPSPLVSAILSRDIAHLQNTIAESNDLNYEIINKITPLGLACCIDWFAAVKALFSAGAADRLMEPEAILLIYIVCGHGSPKTIYFTLTKLCEDILLYECHYSFHMNRIQYCLAVNMNISPHRQEVLDFVISAFACSRRRFTDMAQRGLSQAYQHLLPTEACAILNRNIATVVRAMDRRDIVPSIIFPGYPNFDHYESIYYTKYLTSYMAQSLWNAGFQELDAPSCCVAKPSLVMFMYQHMCQSTALSVNDYASLFEWLGNKGCKFLSDESPRLAHVPTVCGYMAGYQFLSRRKDPSSFQYLGDLLRPFVLTRELEVTFQTRDDCDCACSASGCTMIGAYFRYWICSTFVSKRTSMSNISQCIDFFIGLFEQNGHSSSPIKEEIIRIMLFHMHDIEHTCCRLGKPQEDPATANVQCSTGLPSLGNYHLKQRYLPSVVAEIQKDEAEMIAKLEIQVTEATHRAGQYKGAFSSCLLKTLLEWFWYEDPASTGAQSKAARRLGARLERRKRYRDRGFCDPCNNIHLSINQWMKQGAADQGYSRHRSRRIQQVTRRARYTG